MKERGFAETTALNIIGDVNSLIFQKWTRAVHQMYPRKDNQLAIKIIYESFDAKPL